MRRGGEWGTSSSPSPGSRTCRCRTTRWTWWRAGRRARTTDWLEVRSPWRWGWRMTWETWARTRPRSRRSATRTVGGCEQPCADPIAPSSASIFDNTDLAVCNEGDVLAEDGAFATLGRTMAATTTVDGVLPVAQSCVQVDFPSTMTSTVRVVGSWVRDANCGGGGVRRPAVRHRAFLRCLGQRRWRGIVDPPRDGPGHGHDPASRRGSDIRHAAARR